MTPKMLAIGPGPGPKNVLVLLDDGTQMVVPYAIWKFKLKGQMADKKATYVTVVGFVQFEPNEREYDGGQLRDITLKPPGDPEKLIRVTLWPEWEHVPVEQGDFVAADGVFTRDTYTAGDGTKKTSLQISAKKLNVNGKRFDAEGGDDRKVVKAEDSEESDLF